MSQNLLKRLITSIILLSMLIFINFSHQYIFIVSILIIGLITCLEANNIFSFINKKKMREECFIKGYEQAGVYLINIIKELN